MSKFILSKKKALEQFEKVRRISDIVSYSSKTNPKLTPILERKTNCMFSIHMVTELKNIVDYSRVLFLAQAWNEEVILDLLMKGIRWFVIDNENDFKELYNLIKMNDIRDRFGKINLLFRMKLKENTLRTEKYYVFGIFSDVIVKLISKIEEEGNRDSFENIGIHFHRKSQNISEWKLKFELENTFKSEFFEKINVINIGGGLPSIYSNTNIQIFEGIFLKIKEIKDWLNKKGINLMIEPGRFIAAPAGRLVSRVIGLHEDTIIVDASVYNGDLDALVIPVKLLIDGESKNKMPGYKQYIIKGITPCSLDLFRYRVYLKEKQIGDKIIFLNAGAYNFSSDFCDMEPLETEMIE